MTNEFALNEAFCCPGLQNSIESAGERGAAVLVYRSSVGIGFYIQSRGVAFDDVDKLALLPPTPDIKINVSSEIGLTFCPWCGRQLSTLVDASPEVFEKLAQTHRSFLRHHSQPR